MRELEAKFDITFDKQKNIKDLICELKKMGATQGESHIILFNKFKEQYTFFEIKKLIVNSDCWKDMFSQNDTIDQSFEDFFNE